jgi:hypothetical protein
LISSDRRVIFEKLIYCRSTLDVVEQMLDRDAGTLEAGCSAHAFRIYPDDFAEYALLFRRHSYSLPLICLKNPLPQPDRLRRYFDKLIVANKLNRLFQVHQTGRH